MQLDIEGEKIRPYKLNNFFDDFLSLFFLFRIFHTRKALSFKDNTGLKAMKVDVIPGSYMFTSFKKFKKMGFFYPDTFLFCEERFVAAKAKELKLNNYILLDENYIHAHSKTINKSFNKVKQFRLMYSSWLEYTKVCRSNGKMKALLLAPFIQLSLFEMKIIYRLNDLLKK
jgi:GT2 family glycosyltransferase